MDPCPKIRVSGQHSGCAPQSESRHHYVGSRVPRAQGIRRHEPQPPAPRVMAPRPGQDFSANGRTHRDHPPPRAKATQLSQGLRRTGGTDNNHARPRAMAPTRGAPLIAAGCLRGGGPGTRPPAGKGLAAKGAEGSRDSTRDKAADRRANPSASRPSSVSQWKTRPKRAGYGNKHAICRIGSRLDDHGHREPLPARLSRTSSPGVPNARTAASAPAPRRRPHPNTGPTWSASTCRGGRARREWRGAANVRWARSTTGLAGRNAQRSRPAQVRVGRSCRGSRGGT